MWSRILPSGFCQKARFFSCLGGTICWRAGALLCLRLWKGGRICIYGYPVRPGAALKPCGGLQRRPDGRRCDRPRRAPRQAHTVQGQSYRVGHALMRDAADRKGTSWWRAGRTGSPGRARAGARRRASFRAARGSTSCALSRGRAECTASAWCNPIAPRDRTAGGCPPRPGRRRLRALGAAAAGCS